jgi:uncharacterized repeat protein (TIGR01451 family)
LPLGNAIRSGVISLNGNQPIGEPVDPTNPSVIPDNRANMTLDFGFVPIGLYVTKDDGYNAIVTGQETTYTITLSNPSGAPVTGVVLTDQIPTNDPEGFDPASISWTCSATGGAVCPTTSGTNANLNEAIGDMPTGSQVVYQVTARVRPCVGNCGTSIVNTVDVTSNEYALIQATDTNGIIADPPSGVKIGTAFSGTIIRWEMVWISTTDPSVGQPAVITDTLPANQTPSGNLVCHARGSSITTLCELTGNTITWEGTIYGGTGNQVEFVFDVTVAGAGDYINSATLNQPSTNVEVSAVGMVTVVDDATPAPTLTQTPAPMTGTPLPPITQTPVSTVTPAPTTVITTQTQTPMPEASTPSCALLSVVSSPSYAGSGMPIDWTVTVYNPNGDSLSDTVITLPLPSELSVQDVIVPAHAQATHADGLITIRIPVLGAGEQLIITIKTQVRNDVVMPFTITLTARLNDCTSASASLGSVASLPETGETPILSGRLVLLIGSLLGAILWIAVGSGDVT